MDIVTRLKTFINYIAVPVTQFADNCRIPRPTLSQLLNGRNKKVSDELIGKIHETYPQLSVLWLMFGEGNMLHEENIETSAPQNGSLFDCPAPLSSENEASLAFLDFGNDFKNETPSGVSAQRTDAPAVNSVNMEMNTAPTENADDAQEAKTTLSFNSSPKKKIVNIIVYYNDNSFESFVPSPNK